MGIFSSQIEKELEEIYVPLLSTIVPNRVAKKTFKQLLSQAKISCKKNGITDNTNMSELLIEVMNSTEEPLDEAEKFRKDYVEVRKKEGVLDSDIRSWWGLHFLERAIILEIDNFFRTTHALGNLDKGLSMDESVKLMRKDIIIYGEPNDVTHTTGDNRPLPSELKDRINRYVEKRANENPTKFKEEIQNYETYNAFIRAEIEKGNI